MAYKTEETTIHENFVPVAVWLLEKAIKKTAKSKKKAKSEVADDDSCDSNGMPMHLV